MRRPTAACKESKHAKAARHLAIGIAPRAKAREAAAAARSRLRREATRDLSSGCPPAARSFDKSGPRRRSDAAYPRASESCHVGTNLLSTRPAGLARMGEE